MMTDLYKRMLVTLAGATQPELRRQIQYLKAENQILRSKIEGPIRLTKRERSRLVKLGKPLGDAIKSLISIVKPETFMKWVNDAGKKKPKVKKQERIKPGRPRTPDEVRDLILRMARESGWGFTRIKFQLEQIGIKVARSTIIAILKEAGLPTGPERGEQSWDEFIRAHSKTLWACDFASKKVLAKGGWKDAFFLIFIHLKSRHVHITPATFTPTQAWSAEQVGGFTAAAREAGHRARILIRDRDGKFGTRFDHALRENKVEPVMLPHRSPNMNAYAERFIQTLQVECLNKFIAFGTTHLDYLNAEFCAHYNLERMHSIIGRTPAGPQPPKPVDLHSPNTTFRLKHSITSRTRRGGTLRTYERKAA